MLPGVDADGLRNIISGPVFETCDSESAPWAGMTLSPKYGHFSGEHAGQSHDSMGISNLTLFPRTCINPTGFHCLTYGVAWTETHIPRGSIYGIFFYGLIVYRSNSIYMVRALALNATYP